LIGLDDQRVPSPDDEPDRRTADGS
jgi:hypothetical protein